MKIQTRDPRDGPNLIKDTSLYPYFPSFENNINDNALCFKNFDEKIDPNINLKIYKYFILNRSKTIKPKEVYPLAVRIFSKNDFKIKRIVKPLFKYVRISVNANLPDNVIRNGMKSIALSLEASFKEQLLKRRPDLESQPKKENDLSSVMTLNINGINGKYHELLLLLEQRKPDIICLQETKKMISDKRIYINGYILHEVHASSTSSGLAIGLRKSAGLLCNIIESHDDAIVASIKGNKSNIIVGNIYRSPETQKRKETTMRVVDIFRKYSTQSHCLLVGDWNETPNALTKKLLKKGIQVYSNNAPTEGTRIDPNNRRTKRPIDFGISSSKHLIEFHDVKRNWIISDHLPVEVKIKLTRLEIQRESYITIFDRKMLQNIEITKAIKNHNYDIMGLDSINGITKFHNELNKTLNDLKVIRTERKRENIALIPKSIKRAIALKNKTGKKVRKGLCPASDLIESRKAIKKAIYAHKRKTYLGSINKGIQYLKSNDFRNSWKWINLHTGRTRSKSSVDQIYIPNTKETECDADERLKIWAGHFKNLSLSGSNGSETNEINYINEDISLITDDQITWSEISSVIKQMRKGKATGTDLIPGEIYKLVENETEPISQLSKSILKLFNDVYNGDKFPLEWKDCTIVPIFKKGDRLDPNNYRGIALINTLLKVITKVIAERLQIVCLNLIS